MSSGLVLGVLLLNAAATWALVGLIWTVQLVHYALFGSVGAMGWAAYHKRHLRGITLVVAPLMGIELVTAALLCWRRPDGVPPWMAGVGLALVALVWGSTAWVQVPLHKRLAESFDPEAMGSLVTTNWVRTVVWTLRGALVLVMVWLAAT